MEFKGLIYLRQLKTEPLEIEVQGDESWLREALMRAAPPEERFEMSPKEWAEKVQYSGSFRIQDLGSEYLLDGSFTAQVPSACHYCMEPFVASRSGSLRVVLKRMTSGEIKREPSDDPDFILLDKDVVDLSDIISEHLIVEEPIAETQHRLENGELSCAQNSQKARQDAEIEGKSPFAALKNLKGRL